jgi:hypothetical protein
MFFAKFYNLVGSHPAGLTDKLKKPVLPVFSIRGAPSGGLINK